MSDNIIVKWIDDSGGWREGVLCAIVFDDDSSWVWTYDVLDMKLMLSPKYESDGTAECVIYDRHRNERCIVPLCKVSLVKPMCQICDGEGEYEKSVEGKPCLATCECCK